MPLGPFSSAAVPVPSAQPATPLPANVAPPGVLDVDDQEHVWFAGGDALWRWAPKPGFALHADPPWVWMTPAATRVATLHVQAMEGFSGTVSLTVGSLPAGIAVTVTPATVTASATATVAITTTAAVALADHPVGISGVGASATGPLTVTQPITVRVTAEVFNLQLPVVAL